MLFVEEILTTQRLIYGLPRDKEWENTLLQRLTSHINVILLLVSSVAV